MNYGWCYYKRGSRTHVGKVHFIKKSTWHSLCGVWKIRLEEQNYIHFVDKTELSTNKICKVCEILLCGCDCHMASRFYKSIPRCDKCKANHVVVKFVS